MKENDSSFSNHKVKGSFCEVEKDLKSNSKSDIAQIDVPNTKRSIRRLGIVSVSFGLASTFIWLIFGWLSIPGIIIGSVGLYKDRKPAASIIGIVLNVIGLIIFLMVYVYPAVTA